VLVSFIRDVATTLIDDPSISAGGLKKFHLQEETKRVGARKKTQPKVMLQIPE